MRYYTAQEMKQLLDHSPQHREKLYCRGFFLTNQACVELSDYPFYGNWREEHLAGGFNMYLHKDTTAYTYKDSERLFFIVGHAYDPFQMLTDEVQILERLSAALDENEDAFWNMESNLTGIFCLGYIEENVITFTTDCTGMQIVYYGLVDNSLYIASHSKLVADLCDLKQDLYVRELVRNRFYRYFGIWLPGDLSPYLELKRLQSNHAGCYDADANIISVNRYYPKQVLKQTETEDEYRKTICDLSEIISNSMKLIVQKWPDKRVGISLTGGQDSKTTLACSNGCCDKYNIFSYISNAAEAVDAKGAREICRQLNLPHTIYEIPEDDNAYEDLDVFRIIMECNAGCIGRNNANDIRKRLYFSQNSEFDIEVKSWVNEIGRARFYKRYNKRRFPQKLTASYCRTLYKIIFSPHLIHSTNKIFENYLKQYYSGDVFALIPWMDLFYWEFVWGSGEGLFLTAEHRVSYEITIPFNNRRYLEKMLSVPLQKRIDDSIPKDIVAYRNWQLSQCGVSIKDIGYTKFRAFLERGYLEIFSRLGF